MERKKFLQNSLAGIGALVALPTLMSSCSKDDNGSDDIGTGTVTDGGTNNTDCALAPSETAGPFPTKNPSSLVKEDIRSDREGYQMDMTITITDQSNGCTPIEGALVDVWHCDRNGEYSEYGGTGMQRADHTGVHFLRGRQVANSQGQVSFTSIFPGWYMSRATHIHVHVYDASGNSLKITQIAFPEGSGTAVALVDGYDKGMNGYTYNSSDNVFSDDSDGVQVSQVTGSLEDGFTLVHQINV